MKTNTQSKQIYDFMKANGGITQRDAYKMGIYRLASRIWDLKEAGHHIVSTTIEVTNADGSKSRVARYALVNGK